MKEAEYSFKIHAYSPETFPMERLGQYIAELGTLLGEVNSVHFVALKEGSTDIRHRVKAEAVPKVEENVREVGRGNAGVVHLNAYREINRKLKEDNAIGVFDRIDGDGAQLLRFPGREEEDPAPPDIVVQTGMIDGIVISLGGRDNTVPVRIQDGDTIYKCTTSREIARLLGPHIYGDELRLIGEGRWLRTHDGEWSLDHFKIQSFDALDVRPLIDVVNDLRASGGNWDDSADAWAEIQELRNGE